MPDVLLRCHLDVIYSYKGIVYNFNKCSYLLPSFPHSVPVVGSCSCQCVLIIESGRACDSGVYVTQFPSRFHQEQIVCKSCSFSIFTMICVMMRFVYDFASLFPSLASSFSTARLVSNAYLAPPPTFCDLHSIFSLSLILI